MKPILEKLSINDSNPVYAQKFELQRYDAPWHYHPEYELTFIKSSSGIRFVGDHAEEFEEGDLVLLGSNLPHYWKNHENCSFAESIVIQFTDAWIQSFPFASKIVDLLEKSKLGLKFGLDYDTAYDKMLQIVASNSLERCIQLIMFLQYLYTEVKIHTLASKGFQQSIIQTKDKNWDKVFTFIKQEFKNPISLNEVSAIVPMSKEAFCRKFKIITRTTFSNYVNEYRIGYASKLIKETNLSISQISLESGFNQLSYFDKIFLQKKGIHPSQYRKLN
ncbi:MAG: AraC family transcriptional regulator [Bacteroidota bacterium]|nr:AraC family transcriptional regulator [Bacteroidota bacterium]